MKEKKWTIHQRLGRLEKVASQLYIKTVELEQRLKGLSKEPTKLEDIELNDEGVIELNQEEE
jgi:hypothetical protein